MSSKAELTMIALQRSLRHDGGTPSMFLETLADAIEKKTWEEFGLTFRQMIESEPPEGIGSNEETVKKVITLKHKYEDIDPPTAKRMRWLREQVGRLLDGELGEHGNGPGRGNKRALAQNSFSESTGDTAYIRARLKRDKPALYEQVAVGAISAHKAGQEAGFIKKRQKFVPGDVQQTIGALKRHYDPEGFEELQAAIVPSEVERLAQIVKRRLSREQVDELITLLVG